MNIIDSYTPGCNFWELHTHLTAINPFKEIYAKDKSKRKQESSILMWFVAFCYDMESKFEVLETEEKHSIVGEDFCNNKEFYQDNKEDIDMAKAMYCKLQDTVAKRSLRRWKDKLEERDLFIAGTKFTLDSYNDQGRLVKGTADQLDKMLTGTAKLWADYERILKSMSEEENVSEGRGGATPSASDEGDI